MSENNEKKKKELNFIWWLIIVVSIAFAITTWPMFVFGLAIIVGICYWLIHSPPESAKINKKEEEIKETEAFFADTIKEMKENRSKTDSFYSGISKGSSIDGKEEKMS